MGTVNRALYRLIISQLRDDGFGAIATTLSERTRIPAATDIPTNQLAHLVKIGNSMMENKLADPSLLERDTPDPFSLGIDLDVPSATTVPTPNYQSFFVTTHKGPVRVARFSRDGQYLATGSEDNCVKLLDVGKMKTLHQKRDGTDKHPQDLHPMKKTFYHHSQSINDIDFHPYQTAFASAGQDATVQFCDIRQPNGKRSARTWTETDNVNSLRFHPSGDFLLVGTDHPMIRVYDVKTSQAFTSIQPQDHHYSKVNQVRWSEDGSFYVSCSADGYVKIWDSVTNRCERQIPKAHGGHNVIAISLSRSGRYLLSSGTDSVIKLWDMASGEAICSYDKHKYTSDRGSVEFSHNEEYILAVDENSSAAIVYNTRSTELEQRLVGHNGIVRYIASSPLEPALMTCSDDFRSRFWYME